MAPSSADGIGLRAPFFVATVVYLLAVPLVARIVSNQTIADLKARAAAEKPNDT